MTRPSLAPPRSAYAGLCLTALATLMFEILLTRIFSATTDTERLLDGLGVFGAPTIGFMMLGHDTFPALYGNAGIFAGATMLVALPFVGPAFRYVFARERR